MKTIHSKIAGVSRGNRQEIIRESLNPGDPLFLQREDENKHDENAIAILDWEDKKIGYINSSLAAELAPLMDRFVEIDCKVTEITGQDKDTLGVNILLTIFTPEETQARNLQARAASQANPGQIPAQPKVQKATVQKVKVVHQSDKNFWVLLIMFALLGIVGGHRWYAGRGSWIYSLTLGYFLIGFCIDFLVIITGGFKDGHGYAIRP